MGGYPPFSAPVQKLISRDRLSATIPPSDPTYRSQGRKPRRHEKPMVVHARKAPHGSHSLLIRKFRIVQPHRQRRQRYRPPCQRHPSLCRFANNKNHDLRSSVNHAHGFYAVQLSFSIKSMYSCHSTLRARVYPYTATVTRSHMWPSASLPIR